MIFEDRFSGRLGEGWSWLREDPEAWRLEDGELLIRSLPGALYRQMNNCRNVLLRPMPDAQAGPLIIEVTMSSQPKNEFEHAGIVWYRGDDDYVVISKEYYLGRLPTAVQMVREEIVGGQMSSKVTCHTPYDMEQVSLRLQIEGTTFTGQYRAAEQEPWQTVGQIQLDSIGGGPKIGLITGFGSQDEVRWVRFSNFRILQDAGR
ncbi:MAG: hypothetical protein HZA50_15215 [Planctomycetes bacterium]|nr:hypothetical protein [Planctomycetota bacterium]